MKISREFIKTIEQCIREDYGVVVPLKWEFKLSKEPKDYSTYAMKILLMGINRYNLGEKYQNEACVTSDLKTHKVEILMNCGTTELRFEDNADRIFKDNLLTDINIEDFKLDNIKTCKGFFENCINLEEDRKERFKELGLYEEPKEIKENVIEEKLQLKLKIEDIYNGILGLLVGDALGVPLEFSNREDLRVKPVREFREYGTHNQPLGTWSDDGSMTLATLDSLIEKKKVDLDDMMDKFCNWRYKGAYTSGGKTFDVGRTTDNSLCKYLADKDVKTCGCYGYGDNGNGSLMRILPLAFYDIYAGRYNEKEIGEVSALTHGNELSIECCRIYIRIALGLIAGLEKSSAIHNAIKVEKMVIADRGGEFPEVLEGLEEVYSLRECEIKTDGFVANTLKASIWLLMNTENFKDCVFKAVNMGDDTDTTAAVVGGLAGIYYGVPEDMVNKLANKEYVDSLIDKCREWGI